MDANRVRIPAHTVRREYRLFGDDEAKASRVTADVEYLPPETRNFRIVNGSGRAEGVVKKILSNEREGARRQELSEFSRQNYRFTLLGEAWLDGAQHYVLEITPLRKEKYLLRGRIWVDKDSHLVRRAVGSPAKSPSWWVKDVQVTLEFRRVGAFWIQHAAAAVADVRLFGRHYLTSRDLSFQAHSASADRLRKSRPAAAIGAGVIR